MASINTGRVALGGLLAGVVIHAINYITNSLLLGARWVAESKALNPDLLNRVWSNVALGWLAVDIASGILLVWIYAAIRPRFGPGPGTAVRAGLALWLATYLMFASYGFNRYFSYGLVMESSLGGLVAALVGGVVGCWLYKE